MGQETWGLKLDAELKEKLQGIIKDDFESSKDFMEQVVSLYELNKLKQGENVLTAEVEELESLTRRINGIFINANAKINSMLQDKDNRAEQQQELKQKLIERLQNDIAKLEQEKEQVSNINDSLTVINEEYKQQVKQLTKSKDTLEQLVTEYKEKNDLLTGTLTEYKAEHENNKLLQEQNKELQNKLHELNIASTEQAKQIIETDKKLQEQAQRHENDLQNLKAKYGEELNTTKARAEIEANMKLLELKVEHQVKIQALQEKHNAEIEQYQTKYRELLEQLEQKKEDSKIEVSKTVIRRKSPFEVRAEKMAEKEKRKNSEEK